MNKLIGKATKVLETEPKLSYLCLEQPSAVKGFSHKSLLLEDLSWGYASLCGL